MNQIVIPPNEQEKTRPICKHDWGSWYLVEEYVKKDIYKRLCKQCWRVQSRTERKDLP